MKIELDKEKKILNVLCDCGVRGKITLDEAGNAKIESVAVAKKEVEKKEVDTQKKNISFFETLFNIED